MSPIPALLPRDGQGHQFIFYGDCCSGTPGKPYGANFAAVNAVVRRLFPAPEFLCFLGDHVMGMTKDYEVLRGQWQYWLEQEMSWLSGTRIPIYHTTSNHNTYDRESEEVWREILPHLPRNGPPGQEGLSYFVRRGDLLLVAANTSFSGLGGYGHVESEWLNQVLEANTDARHKLVLGHHPVFPVNGYAETPLWCIEPEQGEAFWKVLAKHGVLAFLCSHIIAFDVQVHEGVLQVLSGGAGTNYGPGGFMPGPIEYLHAVQAALDSHGLCYQVIDVDGRIRESLIWPFSLPTVTAWSPIAESGWDFPCYSRRPFIQAFHISGTAAQLRTPNSQVLVCGVQNLETAPTVWIGLEGEKQELSVRMRTGSGEIRTWTGPSLAAGEPFHFQLAIHSGMGPGGVLYRESETSAWSSLCSPSPVGAEAVDWPLLWLAEPSGVDDRFAGAGLRIAAYFGLAEAVGIV